MLEKVELTRVVKSVFPYIPSLILVALLTSSSEVPSGAGVLARRAEAIPIFTGYGDIEIPCREAAAIVRAVGVERSPLTKKGFHYCPSPQSPERLNLQHF